LCQNLGGFDLNCGHSETTSMFLFLLYKINIEF